MSTSRIGLFVCSYVKNHYLCLKSNRRSIFQSVRTFSVTKTSNMKYVQFVYNAKPKEIRVGYLEGDGIVDINKNDSTIQSTMLEILKGGNLGNVQKLKSGAPSIEPKTSVTLVAPITGMDKVLCVALNYADHCKEQNLELPKLPIIFNKFPSCVIGPNEPVRLRTDVTRKVDWEVELTVVIGKPCSGVKAADAYNYIFGYSIAQDISSRDWQKERNGGQFLLGKAQDTFCPIGPCITTSDEIVDPHTLDISCSVNGQIKQKSNTTNLVHRIPEIIERVSSVLTLLPGDIILTGTPGGVGLHSKPPQFLQPGDVLYSEIQNIGSFEVKIVKF